MKKLITLCFIGFAMISQAQMSMSFTGNYNVATTDLKDNFNNGLGITSGIYYNFNNSPLSISLNVSYNNYKAKSEYEQNYKIAQQNIFDFNYDIYTLSIPVLVSVSYNLFDNSRIQPIVGFGAGVSTFISKIKQSGKYTSDTETETETQFVIYPHLGAKIKVTSDVGIILQGGYNQTFGIDKKCNADIRLGVIYNI